MGRFGVQDAPLYMFHSTLSTLYYPRRGRPAVGLNDRV